VPKTRRLSDATLVRRSQQGDRRAFGALVNRYDSRLRALAYALLLDGRQMDTAMSIAYLRAWRDVVRVQPRDDVGPWFYRAVYNACIDQLRRSEPPQGAGTDDGLPGALASLAPADRVAVVLVEREGFTPASAARILGVSAAVIDTRLELARERLRPFVPEAPTPAPAPDEEGATTGDEPVAAEAGADVAETSVTPAGAAAAVAAVAAGPDGESAGGAAGAPGPEGAAEADAEVRVDAEAPSAPVDAATPGNGDGPAAVTGAGTAADEGATGSGADDTGSSDESPLTVPSTDEPTGTPSVPAGTADRTSGRDAPDPADAPATATGADPQPGDRSTVPVEPPPDPDHEGVRVLQPVGSATGSGHGAEGSPDADAPALPEGDAHLEHTPDDLSEEIVIAEEDAAAARRAAVRQAR
jgi:RNA polymerase sigma-70 factor (ECF subfamily)